MTWLQGPVLVTSPLKQKRSHCEPVSLRQPHTGTAAWAAWGLVWLFPKGPSTADLVKGTDPDSGAESSQPVHPLTQDRYRPRWTYQVSDPIPGVIHEREDESKLGRVDQGRPQAQGLHELQVRLKAPGEQQGRQTKQRDP